MPQGYDPQITPPPQQKEPSAPQPKPTYQGLLNPRRYTYQTPEQVQRYSGKGTVSVYAMRSIDQDKVATAIRWWNAAANAPLFRQVYNHHTADVVIRYQSSILGDETGAIADVENHDGRYYVNLPAQYPAFRAGLLAHELGHTVGLGDTYTVWTGRRYVEGFYPAASAAQSTTRAMLPYSTLVPGAGGHRIMTGGGAPSQAEAQTALEQVGLSDFVASFYRAIETGGNKKRAPA